MWPSRSAAASRPSGIPLPSSATSSRIASAVRRTLTRTREAPACLAALVSSSRASAITRSSRTPSGRRVDRQLAREGAVAGLLVGDGAERRLQPGHLERDGVQVDHDLAQRPDRAADAGPRAVEVLAAVRQPQQLLVEREQVLQRAVVQHLGDLAPRALLGVERLRHEPPARGGLLGDLLLGAQPRDRAVEHVGHRLQEHDVLRPDRARMDGVGGQRAVGRGGVADHHAAPLRTPAAASTAGCRKRRSRPSPRSRPARRRAAWSRRARRGPPPPRGCRSARAASRGRPAAAAARRPARPRTR